MLEGGTGSSSNSTPSENQIMQDYSGPAFGTGGGGVTGNVYMGMVPGVAPGVTRDSVLTGSYGVSNMARQPLIVSKQQAYDYLNNLNGKQLAQIRAKMVYGGLIQDNDGILEMETKWKKLVDASAGMTKAGQKYSPMDILDSYLGNGPLGGKGGLGPNAGSVWQVQYRAGRKFLVNTQTGQVKYEGPRFQTTYQKNIDLTDPTTAKAVATSVFQQLMHRDPGQGELSGYGDALRQAEQANPAVTQTTTEYDPNTGEPIGQTNKTTGGVTAEGRQYLAEQRVKGSKEYASVQAATTYMNALESAILNNPFGSI